MKGEYNLTIQLLAGNEEFELAYVPPDIFDKLRYGVEGKPAVFSFVGGLIQVWPTSHESLQVRLEPKRKGFIGQTKDREILTCLQHSLADARSIQWNLILK